jgi:hypothetical protein
MSWQKWPTVHLSKDVRDMADLNPFSFTCFRRRMPNHVFRYRFAGKMTNPPDCGCLGIVLPMLTESHLFRLNMPPRPS